MATTVREASGDGTDSEGEGEGEGRHLPVRPDGDVGYHDSGRGEAILLVHAGVFSDWFRPLSLQLPRDRFRVVRLRRAGYRGSASPAVWRPPRRNRHSSSPTSCAPSRSGSSSPPRRPTSLSPRWSSWAAKATGSPR